MRWTARAASLAVSISIAITSIPAMAGEVSAQTLPDARTASPATLTLQQAVSEALDSYPTVRAAQAVSEAAQASLGQSKAARWPDLNVGGLTTRFEEPMIVTPIHAFTPGQTPDFDRTLIQAGGTLNFVLLDGGARRARIETAGGEASGAAADLGTQTQALVATVAATYLDVLTGEEVLAAHDHRITAFESELRRVRQRLDVGRAAQLEVLRVEAALASARSDRVSVAASLDLADRELARLIGAPRTGDERRALAPLRLVEAALPSRDALLARAYAANPALEAARRRQDAAQARVSIERSIRWPRVELNANLVDRGGLTASHTTEWAATAQVAVPLFTGGRIGRGIARSEAEARVAGERTRLAATEIERAVDRAVSLIEETDARARSLETAAARSEEVVRIESLRLETETGTQTDYLDAQAGLLAAQADLAAVRHARILARIELARALGELTPEWLAQTVGAER